MLTRKQHQLLLFIEQRLAETGVSPSYDEMRDALDLKSKSGIHRLISSLEERGFIRRLAHKARAVDVVRLPENVVREPRPMAQKTRSRFSGGGEQPAQTGFTIPHAHVEAAAAAAVSVPLPGKIAAGTPIEALADTSTRIDVPTALLGSSGDHYALVVEGDSMIEAGILDGDVAIIRRCASAEDGAIVVALVDREEATLKRLNKQGKQVFLEPANRHYKTMVYDTARVEIQGCLVALMRDYR